MVKVKFVSKVANSCHVCGRELDTEISRACGIGPVCADHLMIPRPTLATAKETLKEIGRIAATIGEVGPVWIPKSQIKREINTSEAPQPAPTQAKDESTDQMDFMDMLKKA